MAETFKVIAQVKPSAATLTDGYTVPAATSAVISTIVVCNQGAATSFRISIAVAGAADTPKQYLFFDTPLAVNTSITVTIGVTLATTDVVRVYNTLATCSFNIFGAEIT